MVILLFKKRGEKMKKKLIIIDIISIILIILFILMLFGVNLGFFTKIDTFTYNLIKMAINPTLTHIFKIITFLGSTIGIIIFSIIILLILKDNYKRILYLAIVVGGVLLNSLLKVLIHRPRPDVLKLVYENSYSFPSGHTLASSLVIGFLLFLIWESSGRIKKSSKVLLSTLLVIISILIVISRIYLGAHYLSDCLGAYLLASIILINSITLFKKFYSPSTAKE